ncbi:unnamed protein product [Hydatigera taeniaeformis]|uniref:PCRF domain-containing protein n=1 Tax=Hydatigena taeniaeformis TaxID=6205 RepID=A0A0R3WS39_HYDTA|nr:unnamed protein product [Hydatigera taeniaeformis]
MEESLKKTFKKALIKAETVDQIFYDKAMEWNLKAEKSQSIPLNLLKELSELDEEEMDLETAVRRFKAITDAQDAAYKAKEALKKLTVEKYNLELATSDLVSL